MNRNRNHKQTEAGREFKIEDKLFLYCNMRRYGDKLPTMVGKCPVVFFFNAKNMLLIHYCLETN